MFSNATEEHPLLYIRYRNVGSGNSVTVEVDSEYTMMIYIIQEQD